MKRPYPELGETIERVAQVIAKEEENFFGTIDAGLDRIERLFATLQREGRDTVSGVDAFDMYQTHGFPPELFETMASEQNLGFDWEGFHGQMEKHGQISGSDKKMELFKSGPLDALKKTLDPTKFLGYESIAADGTIVGIIARGQLCEQVHEIGHATPIAVVLDQTPFYGESGGQVGDVGELVGPGCRFEIVQTLKEDGFVLHEGHLRQAGSPSAGRSPPGSMRPDGRAFAGPTRPRTSCTTRCKSTWAGTPSSRARRSIATGCGSTSPILRRWGRKRSPRSKPKSTPGLPTARKSAGARCPSRRPVRPAP